MKRKRFLGSISRRVRGVLVIAALVLGSAVVATPAQAYYSNSQQDFEVKTHVQNIGWTTAPGTRGQGLRIEAIQVTQKQNKVICLKAHVEAIGWQAKQCTSGKGTSITVGTTGRGLRVEAVEVTRPNNSYGVAVLAHIQNVGDRMTSVSKGIGGFTAGTTGKGLRLEWFELSNN